MTAAMGPAADEAAFRRCVEDIVARKFGAPPPIGRIEHRRSEYAGWYASEVVTVQLEAGRELKIFLKNFGTNRGLKDGMAQRRERELQVYRDLLADADLDTARYYGSVWDEAGGRFWLLLEFVEGMPVRYCGFEYWVEAAAWLGRLQGYFARNSDRFGGCDGLVQHNADFFSSKGELALRAVSQISVALAGRL